MDDRETVDNKEMWPKTTIDIDPVKTDKIT